VAFERMKLSAPAISDLSWLNPTPHAIAVYASSPLSPVATQHSLPSRRYSLLGPDLYVAPDVKRFFWTWHRAVRIRLVWDFLCQGCITPFLSCFVASFFVRPAPRAFFRPDRILPSPSRTTTPLTSQLVLLISTTTTKVEIGSNAARLRLRSLTCSTVQPPSVRMDDEGATTSAAPPHSFSYLGSKRQMLAACAPAPVTRLPGSESGACFAG